MGVGAGYSFMIFGVHKNTPLSRTQERLKAHDGDFRCKVWRERKTLLCGASKTTLMNAGFFCISGVVTIFGEILAIIEDKARGKSSSPAT